MDNRTLKRYVRLDTERKELETKIARVKDKQKECEETLKRQFEKAGVQSVKVDGNSVYIMRQLWASAKDGDRQAVCAALKKGGMEDYVAENFNTQSLSAYVRELDGLGDPLPDGLKECVQVVEKFSIRVRKG